MKIDLRRITSSREDTELSVKLLNKYQDFLYNDYPITEESHLGFLGKLANTHDIQFVIEKDGQPCGLVGIVHPDIHNRKTEWGRFVVDEEFKGVGSVVEFMIIEHVFYKMNFNKLYCEVLVSNDPVISMHKKFGFVSEGIFLDHVWKKGAFRDAIFLSLRKAEWEVVRPRFQKLFQDKVGEIRT